MVAVVIPIYREKPLPLEIVSLARCCQVLSKYDIIFVCPDKLDVSWYREFCKEKGTISVESFDPGYFTGIEGYNRLLVSAKFYERFLKYDFILIHQLDAYVFDDTLEHWCALSLDYIGAPWIDISWHEEYRGRVKVDIFKKQSFLLRQLTKIKWKLKNLDSRDSLRVGNGGLSLRKVKTFFDIASVAEKPEPLYNEDVFWSMYVALTHDDFRIADVKTAVSFCFDSKPAVCLSLNAGKLPFATHGWYRNAGEYDGNFDFWKSYIDVNS
ncbi:MAG TPA: DUF5672 family protein [Cyclobacteriaceae bacterium]|nr:DUF5672 family protein [Cyclobacteriaceae bacterium]